MTDVYLLSSLRAGTANRGYFRHVLISPAQILTPPTCQTAAPPHLACVLQDEHGGLRPLRGEAACRTAYVKPFVSVKDTLGFWHQSISRNSEKEGKPGGNWVLCSRWSIRVSPDYHGNLEGLEDLDGSTLFTVQTSLGSGTKHAECEGGWCWRAPLTRQLEQSLWAPLSVCIGVNGQPAASRCSSCVGIKSSAGWEED